MATIGMVLSYSIRYCQYRIMDPNIVFKTIRIL